MDEESLQLVRLKKVEGIEVENDTSYISSVDYLIRTHNKKVHDREPMFGK